MIYSQRSLNLYFETSVYLVATLLIGLTILSGCGTYQSGKGGDGGGSRPSQLNFASLQQSILNPRCVQCHAGPNASGNVDLSSFAKLLNSHVVSPGNPSGSPLFTAVASGIMPRGSSRLSQEEIDFISDWITSGAKEL